MKIIVTHISPDIDALTSCWLIRKYLPGWNKAEIKYVPAGSTLDDKPPDRNPDIIHVDTGLGKFDHHQTDSYTSATLLVFLHLKEKDLLPKKETFPLERFINLITEFDQFQDYFYPESTSDHYALLLNDCLDGLKKIVKDNTEFINIAFNLFEASLINLKNKVSAENEIKKGFELNTKWGKTLVLETSNSDVSKLAMKMGYKLVITKNPEKGFVRAKSPPEKNLDLTPLYNRFLISDSQADWYLHPLKRMLLNGSANNPGMKPSSLTLTKLIEIVRNI